MDEFSGSIVTDNESTRNSTEPEQVNSHKSKNEDVSTKNISTSTNGKPFDLHKLENRLKDGLETCKIKDVTQLSERMKRTEIRIEQYEDEDRNDEAEKERRYLNELKQLQVLSEDICLKSIEFLSKNIENIEVSELENRLRYGLEKCKIRDVTQMEERIKRAEKRVEQYEDEDRADKAEQETRYLRDLQVLQIITEEIFFRKSTGTTSNKDDTSNQMMSANERVGNMTSKRIFREGENKRMDLMNLLEDITKMSSCAEKTVMELLAHLQQTLLCDDVSQNTSNLLQQRLVKIQSQLQEENLFSEKIKGYLQELNRTVHNEDCSSTLCMLNKILKKIRPLNLPEIQRLIKKSEQAAGLINDQDIVLIVGITGSGKSTTIQFLAGAKMKEMLVEIAPGKFLGHITIDGPVTNRALNSVKSSPLSKSETRFLVPVTVPLQDILGYHETGDIILCDAPGFDDTAGPEVDIANSFGMIQALKGCKSVKILALSSYRSLGDRGQGIETLTHILVNMIHDIENRLYAILYGFTKYPSQTDIHALLADIKTSKVDIDPLLRSNSAFVAVLVDMIEKTRDSADKIDPIHGNAKDLIQKLKDLRGIRYPGEVFQLSISQETKVAILDQIHRYKFSIIYALKHKDVNLVMYYLNHFKILSDLIKQSFVQEAYKDCLRLIDENIQEYCTNVIGEINRALTRQGGLKDDDVWEYKTAHDYIQQVQNLREHLGSGIISVNVLVENILSELEKRGYALQEQDLYSPFIGTYLDNFRLLQNSFPELESPYIKACEDLEQRFELAFGQSAIELISRNEFKQIDKVVLQLSKCISILNHHLNGKIEKKYQEIIKLVFEHLETIYDKANSLLMKIKLNHSDIEILQNYMSSLKSAKEISSLQQQISKVDNIKDLNQIYDALIEKIMKYFDEINIRIRELLEKSADYAFDYIEQSVTQMELIRTLPEIEMRTNRVFYHTTENICRCMQQLKKDIEHLFHAADFQSEIINVRPLARSLLRLKNIQWIDRIHPGTYESMIRSIRVELVEHTDELEHRLRKLDFTLKCPKNIPLAQEIVEKMESLIDLEHSIPELKEYRDRINQYFFQITQDAFDHIHKNFDLSEKTISHLKQELIELEQIKNEYDHLYPTRIYLRNGGYSDINQLNDEIDKLKVQQRAELEQVETEQRRLDSDLKDLQSIIQQYEHLTLSRVSRSLFGRVINKINTGFQRSESQFNDHLREKGYANIASVKETITSVQKDCEQIVRLMKIKQTDFNHSLTRLESIRQEYISLLDKHDPTSSGAIDVLRKKGHETYESLEESIQEKKGCLAEYEKQKQMYYFKEKLNTLAANNALMYINNCEKVRHDHVKEIAMDTNQFLRNYVIEFGNFLNKKIERYFKHIIDRDRDDLSQYSEELERCFDELSSLEKYTLVFECLSGARKIEYWHRQFTNYHLSLFNQMEEHKISGRYKEFKNLLTIALALSCLDRFCAGVLPENGFQTSYRHYQKDIATMSQEAYKITIHYISKEDYVNADLRLSDIVETLQNSKFLSHIKSDLERTIQAMMKSTKTSANRLDGKLERDEDHRNKLREIVENLEKVRIVMSRNYVSALIDEEIKRDLRNFENDINQILSKAISNGLQSIEAFIDADSFLEAEKSMEYLNSALHEVEDHYTSKSINTKIEVAKKRLIALPSDILQRYGDTDINNYSKYPPRKLLDELKRASSNGYARYIQTWASLVEKIRVNFSLAIKNARENVFYDRSAKIRAIKDALCFLPDELKIFFQPQIDELNQLNSGQVRKLEFD